MNIKRKKKKEKREEGWDQWEANNGAKDNTVVGCVGGGDNARGWPFEWNMKVGGVCRTHTVHRRFCQPWPCSCDSEP